MPRKPWEGEFLPKKQLAAYEQQLYAYLSTLSPPCLPILSFIASKLTVSEDDYNEGMNILDEHIGFRGPGDTPSAYRPLALQSTLSTSFLRFFRSGKPEYLEQAIYRFNTMLDWMSLDNPNRDEMIRLRSSLQGLRFDGPGVTPPDVETLTYSTSTSESGGLRDLTASLPELDFNLPLMQITTYFEHFNALDVDTIAQLTDIVVIEDGITYCQQLLASYPDSHGILAPIISAARDNSNIPNSRYDRSLSHSTRRPRLQLMRATGPRHKYPLLLVLPLNLKLLLALAPHRNTRTHSTPEQTQSFRRHARRQEGTNCYIGGNWREGYLHALYLQLFIWALK